MQRPTVTSTSAVGSDRRVPEDAVAIVQTDALVALVVADGAGGLGGGARAARLVVEGFEEAMAGGSADVMTQEGWRRILLQLDDLVTHDAEAGESTAIAAVIRNGRVVGASVGDSEAWMVAPDGSYEILTSGQRKARIGSGRASPAGFDRRLDGSIILAATDGLFHAAHADAICSALRSDPTPERLSAFGSESLRSALR